MTNIAEITEIPGTRFCTGPELEAMAERSPVNQSLGRLYTLIQDDKLRPRYGEELFRESQAASPHAERFFGELLVYAVQRNGRRGYYQFRGGLAQNDSWLGYNIAWNPKKIKYVEDNMENPGAVSEEARGIIHARNAGLLRLEVLQDRVYAVPTEALIELASQRIGNLFKLDAAEKDAALQRLMRDTTPSRR